MTRLSVTAIRDLGAARGLPSYLAREVALNSVDESGFASESVAVAAVEVALHDLEDFWA
jgi:hypothetical protein